MPEWLWALTVIVGVPVGATLFWVSVGFVGWTVWTWVVKRWLHH